MLERFSPFAEYDWMYLLSKPLDEITKALIVCPQVWHPLVHGCQEDKMWAAGFPSLFFGDQVIGYITHPRSPITMERVGALWLNEYNNLSSIAIHVAKTQGHSNCRCTNLQHYYNLFFIISWSWECISWHFLCSMLWVNGVNWSRKTPRTTQLHVDYWTECVNRVCVVTLQV